MRRKLTRRRRAELVIADELGIKRSDIPKLRGEDFFDGLVVREMKLSFRSDLAKAVRRWMQKYETLSERFRQYRETHP